MSKLFPNLVELNVSFILDVYPLLQGTHDSRLLKSWLEEDWLRKRKEWRKTKKALPPPTIPEMSFIGSKLLKNISELDPILTQIYASIMGHIYYYSPNRFSEIRIP